MKLTDEKTNTLKNMLLEIERIKIAQQRWPGKESISIIMVYSRIEGEIKARIAVK